jgi:tetratricopeptide (TPR) repeat protein/transcriptional regulator with XRE-family HTH domain
VFGQLVRETRLRLGLSQAQVVERAGLGERGLRNIEAGRIAKPRPVTVRLLADALDLHGPERDLFCAAAFTGRPTEPVPAPTGGPAQLPAGLPGFTGRTDILAGLAARLDGDGTSMPPVAITGTAGVGKTTLAVHFAHGVKDRFPGGQLYVNLRGFDPDQGLVPAGDALGGFLTVLGPPDQAVPTDLAERAAAFRSLIAGRRLLIVLDNARDADHVRPLLPGAGGCLVVVTSRNQLTSLVATEGAHPVPLTVLAHDEARSLIAARVGETRVAREPDAVSAILARCARLPLALSVVAARAAIRPDLPLTALADELRHTGGTSDAPDGGDAVTNLRAVFSWSYRALSADAARMFRLLGVHPGADVDAYAAAAVAGVPVDAARGLLAELVRAGLLSEQTASRAAAARSPGVRYTFHDLLRAYAADRAEAGESDAAMGRLLEHYLYTAALATNVVSPSDAFTRPQVDPPDIDAPTLADVEQAAGWLDAEHANLLAATVLLHGHARDAAIRTGDAACLGRTWRNLGIAYLRQQLYTEAIECYGSAFTAFAEAGDDTGQAMIECDLAGIALYTGDGAQAVERFERALAHFRIQGPDVIIGTNAMNLAEAYEMVGDYPRAIASLHEGIGILHRIEDRQHEAAARNQLGGVYRRLGRFDEAIDEHLTALSLKQENGESGGSVNRVRNDIARVYILTGKLRQAADHCHLALADATANGDQRTEGYALVNLALIDHERDRTPAAVKALRTAIAIFARIRDKAGQAYAHNALGTILRHAGHPAAARTEHTVGLALATDSGDRPASSRSADLGDPFGLPD